MHATSYCWNQPRFDPTIRPGKSPRNRRIIRRKVAYRRGMEKDSIASLINNHLFARGTFPLMFNEPKDIFQAVNGAFFGIIFKLLDYYRSREILYEVISGRFIILGKVKQYF